VTAPTKNTKTVAQKNAKFFKNLLLLNLCGILNIPLIIAKNVL